MLSVWFDGGVFSHILDHKHSATLRPHSKQLTWQRSYPQDPQNAAEERSAEEEQQDQDEENAKAEKEDGEDGEEGKEQRR